jgi:hypothetical protein
MIPCASSGLLESMPVRVHDTRRLTNLRRDQPQLLLAKSEHIHLNVKCIVGSAFGDDAPGQDVEILETLENAGDGPGVAIRDDSQPP